MGVVLSKVGVASKFSRDCYSRTPFCIRHWFVLGYSAANLGHFSLLASLSSADSAASLGQSSLLASLSSADSATSLSCWLVLSSCSLASQLIQRLLFHAIECLLAVAWPVSLVFDVF